MNKCQIVFDFKRRYMCKVCKKFITAQDWKEKNIPICGENVRVMHMTINSKIGNKLEEILIAKTHKKIQCGSCRAEVLRLNTLDYKIVYDTADSVADGIISRGKKLLKWYDPGKWAANLAPETVHKHVTTWVKLATYEAFSWDCVKDNICGDVITHNKASTIVFDSDVSTIDYKRFWIGKFNSVVNIDPTYLKLILSDSEETGNALSIKYGRPFKLVDAVNFKEEVYKGYIE